MKTKLYSCHWLMGLLLTLCTVFTTQAQQNPWRIPSQAEVQKLGTPQIKTLQHKVFQLDLVVTRTLLQNTPKGQSFEALQSNFIFSVPMPDGTMLPFRLVETSLMSPALAQRLPQVKTYAGTALTDKSIHLVMDITQHGFHAFVQSPNGAAYIDPYQQGNTAYYISYWKKEFDPSAKRQTQSFCKLNHDHKHHDTDDATHQHKNAEENQEKKGDQARSSGTQLRTYRLVVAATGEYTQFHNDGNTGNGDAIADAQAAIVTTMNRVRGVYEKEVAISFTLIDNTSVVFDDGTADPFDDDDAGALIEQSQSVINSTIGSANYDIGHTFSTGGGGLAGLGVVCVNSSKARGITGSNQPIGDPYDIDFVAHEIGHQFGALHTFNGNGGACGFNRSGSAAFEPGSGTTIMAYAGICNPQNIQNNSDAYFHTFSYDQILDYTLDDDGNDCPTVSNTGNTPPTVEAGASGFTIPINTPFALTGVGTDADNDALTYCWEQFDLGPAGAPNAPTGNAPLFRSFPPVSSPTRTFPRIEDIVNNTQTLGEILPSYSRDLAFRLTVRDDQNVAGVNYDIMSFAVSDAAGPFRVLAPNTSLSWQAGSNQLVTWDVANTNLPPVNCQTVNILLSKDGGFTYPITLASGVPNNGSFWVAVPNEPTTQARIKIEAADNIFFDISNQNFTITAAPSATFSLAVAQQTTFACAPDNVVIAIQLNSLGGFNSPVNLSVNNLPTGLNSTFAQNPLTPTASTTLTFGNTGAVSSGIYEVNVVASIGGTTRTIPVRLEIVASALGELTLQAPLNNATGASTRPLLSWSALPAIESYQLEIATDENFNSIIEDVQLVSNSFQVSEELDPVTRYYWRVSALSVCGQSTQSEVFSFTTFSIECTQYQATDLPINISDGPPNTINSILNIPDDLSITSIRVPNIQGQHSWISDLTFILISPAGTEVVLLERICGSQDNFDIGFDDNAGSDDYPCPPTDGNVYIPQGNLEDFVGESTQGNWILRIIDNAGEDGGVLQNWTLEVCFANTGNIRPEITQNNILYGEPGQTSYALGSTLLQANDVEDDNNSLLYLIEEAPQQGQLKKGAIDLTVGATFLQSELNQGLITFQPTTSGASLSDSFQFRVIDSGNLSTPLTTFRIEIGFPPVVVTNIPLVDIPGRSPYLITSQLLESTDVEDENSTLTYLIGTTTQNGLLRLQGVALQDGDSFTQTDLNNNRISFVPSNNQTGAQTSFTFRVRDSAGNQTALNTFNINIDVVNSLQATLEGGTRLSPNPTEGVLQLELTFPYQGTLKAKLLSVEGKQVLSHAFYKDDLQTNYSLDLSHLAAGIYFLEIDTEQGKVVRRLIKY